MVSEHSAIIYSLFYDIYAFYGEDQHFRVKISQSPTGSTAVRLLPLEG